MRDEQFSHGRKIRAKTIGDEIINLSSPAPARSQNGRTKIYTAFTWGEIFDRPGLPKKFRILINVTISPCSGSANPSSTTCGPPFVSAARPKRYARPSCRRDPSGAQSGPFSVAGLPTRQ